MSEDAMLFAPSEDGRRPKTLAELRHAVSKTQAAAVEALRKADDVSGEDNGADDLAENFLKADDVQDRLLGWLREWRARDEADFSDEDDWGHPEGPLHESERAMMIVFQVANDRLNDLRMAIWALRARETTELIEAGAVVAPARMPRPRE